jgi:hypothetical protein
MTFVNKTYIPTYYDFISCKTVKLLCFLNNLYLVNVKLVSDYIKNKLFVNLKILLLNRICILLTKEF